MLMHCPGGTSHCRLPMAGATMLLLALALASCSGSLQEPTAQVLAADSGSSTTAPLEPDDPPRAGGRLVVAVPADVNGWNTNLNQWTDGGSMMGPAMIEPLVTQSADGEPEPFLAESWTHDAKYRQWTITVREGIRFHNGQPLDATAVKRNLDAMYQTGLTAIGLGAQYERVDVTGPRTVTVRLRVPWAQYPASLLTAYMMAPAMLDRPDQGTVVPIGTGPFRFVDWQPGKWLKTIRWDGYWRKDKDGGQLPHLNEIEFRPVVNEDARQAGLLSGEFDLVLTASPGTAQTHRGDYTVLRDYTTERTFLILQTEEGADNRGNPFTNVHARRALAQATDSTSLARLVGEGVRVTTQAYRPDSRWGLPADETGYPGFDVNAASREVDLYKRETGRPNFRFTLKTVPEPRLMSVLQEAQAQWRKVGIEATITTMDQVPFSIIVPMGTYQAAYYRGYGVSDPDQNFWFLTEDNVHPVGELSLNFTHYHSQALEQNLHTERENTDFGVRKAANSAIIRELNDQALNIWLYDSPWAIVSQRRVRGLNSFRTHPFGNFNAKPWWGDVWFES
jgi:peptide/nickel transport system substrate-binding protein